MLGSAGNGHGTTSREAANKPANSGAGVPGRIDVRVLKHGVTKPTHAAVWRGFRLGENVDQLAVPHRSGAVADAYALQRIDHRSGIDGVAHDGVADLKRTRRRC